MINTPRLAFDKQDDESGAGGGTLLDELKRLRKGRGVCVVDIGRRVGPHLRAFAGIAADDGPAEMRTKIAHRLKNLAGALPDDLRIAALAAFAIASDARQPSYQDRVDLTASRIRRGPRTARRRMDEAIVQLAQLATARIDERAFVASATTDWYFTEFDVSLILDRDRPEILERGRVMAEAERVTELALPADEVIESVAERVVIERSVCYGGRIDHPISTGDGHSPLVLARPLTRGQMHEFAVQQRILSRRALRPQMLYLPQVRCDRFVLRVRFPDNGRPIYAMRFGPTVERLVVDECGDLVVEFHDLVAGHQYGVGWEPPQPMTPHPRPQLTGRAGTSSPGRQLCGTTSSSPRQMPAIRPITRHAADTFNKDDIEQTILIEALPSSCAGSSTGGLRRNAARRAELEAPVASVPIALETGTIDG
jgi:hypothetical protein